MKDFWNDYKMIILVILSLLIFSFVLMLREEELVNNIGISLFCKCEHDCSDSFGN